MKNYRKEELKTYVIANILLIIWLSDIMQYILNAINEYSKTNIDLIVTPVLLSSIIYIYIFIADSIIPSELKERIVFILKNRPGETIFTDMQNTSFKDSRFTQEQALNKYKDIYDEIGSINDDGKKREIENSKWYSIYLKYQENGSVSEAQKDYLLSRDLCVISVVIFIAFVIISIFDLNIKNEPNICLVILIEIGITMYAANVKAKRFVTNVIARDINGKR